MKILTKKRLLAKRKNITEKRNVDGYTKQEILSIRRAITKAERMIKQGKLTPYFSVEDAMKALNGH